MFQDMWSALNWALGLELDNQDLDVWRMSLRAVIVFVAAIAMIRLGDKRFMGRSTAFDVILGIIFGSVVSRAITGNAPFFPTLAASLILVLLHWVLSAIAFRSPRFGTWVKGHDRQIIMDGELQWEAMRQSHITEHDLYEAMRSSGYTPDVGAVQAAHLERNGEISIILRKQ
ncbi:MAG TPA: YetF domain-containing protein [Herpetosiphonaceae bacterium]|nr:YetF domain-containing protein [Herpetosiphonaceae bacterium]